MVAVLLGLFVGQVFRPCNFCQVVHESTIRPMGSLIQLFGTSSMYVLRECFVAADLRLWSSIVVVLLVSSGHDGTIP